MANNNFSRILLRKGTAEELRNVNPFLKKGEPITEYDTGKMKLGDGIHRWNDLKYANDNTETILVIKNIQYYGDKDITPSDESYFIVNETGETITGLTGDVPAELVIPYEINGIEITTLENSSNKSILDGFTSSISKIVLPNTISKIGNYAFNNCSTLASINIPDGVKTIGADAFDGCTGLESITIPNGIIIIEGYAFNNCLSLASINIPDSITVIDDYAFADCTSLVKIKIPNTVTTIGDYAFNGITPSELTIYCEQGSYAEIYAKENGFNIMYTDINKSDYDNKLNKTEIIDNLESTDTDKALSANQGKELKTLVDGKANKQTSGGGFEGGEGATIGFEVYIMDGNTEIIYGKGGAIGKNSSAQNGGAVGSGASTDDGFAGGYNAKTVLASGSTIDAIQLGTGTNSNSKTLQVYNYQLMDADGNIPLERLSNAPKTEIIDNLESTDTDKALSANQGKELKTLVDSKVNTSDIIDNLTSSDTDKALSANQGKELKTLVDSKADKQNSNGGFEGGKQASATNGGAVGNNASTTYGGAVGNNANAKDGGAVGNGASTTYGGAVGNSANTTNGGAVGSNAKTSSGFAGGYYAKTVDSDGNGIDAIQLGIGTNPKAKTLQVYDYTLMNADGSIPAERLSNAPKTEVIDNLESTDTDKALSANQGKELKTLVDNADKETERLQYYGDKDIIPADESYFITNSEIIVGLTDTGKSQTGTLVIPYEINGVKITTLGPGSDYQSMLDGASDKFTKIILPNTITAINNYAFVSCTSLTSINIPDSVTVIGDYAFYDCSALTSIEIPDGFTSIGNNAFQGCTSLKSISIPNSVTGIGYDAFLGCTSLTSIEIPDGVTSIGAFTGCTSLKSVEIPDGVTRIEDQAFDGCSSLTSVELPNSITHIGDIAFQDCTSLTSVEIPNSVTSIGNNAFHIYNTETHSYTPISGLTIYCEQGSYAETYATNIGFNIVYTDVSDITVTKVVEINIPTEGWTTGIDINNNAYYTIKIENEKLTSNGYPICDLVVSDDIPTARLEKDAYQYIDKIVVNDGNADFYCFNRIPTATFKIRIQIMYI